VTYDLSDRDEDENELDDANDEDDAPTLVNCMNFVGDGAEVNGSTADKLFFLEWLADIFFI